MISLRNMYIMLRQKNIDNNIPDITNLALSTTLNTKMNEVKNEIPNSTNLASTAALAATESKILNVRNLVKKTDHNTKISEIESKITTGHDHDEYITAQELNELISETFTTRLAQAKLLILLKRQISMINCKV